MLALTVCHQAAVQQGVIQQQLLAELHVRDGQRVHVTQHSRSRASSAQEGESALRRLNYVRPVAPNGIRLTVALQGGMSVDSITDLDDNQSRLLEALQLSLPAETPSKKEKQRDKRLSLNPIYRQVPRVVDSCCQHIEKYGEQLEPELYMATAVAGLGSESGVFFRSSGLQTVGIFRVGSSKKRVRQVSGLALCPKPHR